MLQAAQVEDQKNDHRNHNETDCDPLVHPTNVKDDKPIAEQKDNTKVCNILLEIF